MAKVRCICKQCGKEFFLYPSKIKDTYGNFCSRECYGKWRSEHIRGEKTSLWKGGPVKCVCQECGRTFFEKPSRIKQGKGKFCSRVCVSRWVSKHRRGRNSPRWKEKVKCTCKQCGKTFYVIPSKIKQGGGKFCSRECLYKWRSEHESGEKSKSWKGGKVERVCPVCGRHFFVFPAILKNGGGKFCSSSCARKAQKMPKKYTLSEQIFEAICKKYNLPFRYTGDGSFWIHNINPDFVECNGKKIAVEIAGDWWHNPLFNFKLPYNRTMEYRQKILKKYGWKLIFFFEHDLKREDAEVFVLSELHREGICVNARKDRRYEEQ